MTRPDADGRRPLAVLALTRAGAELAFRLARDLAGAEGAVFLPERFSPEYGPRADYFTSLGQALGENFNRFQGLMVIGALGMVVRLLAPHLVSKKEDPAVVVLPQDGRFAISVLSGHLGGGNDLARRAAAALGGQAVITTATDIEGRPALEMLARDLGLTIEDFSRLPAVSRHLAEGGRVAVHDPHDFLRPHLAPWPDAFDFPARPEDAPPGAPLVRVDFRVHPLDGRALTLRPRVLALGLGCHRGIETAEVEDLVRRSLAEAGLAPASVAVLATVETRDGEPALVELSRRLERPLKIFTKAELARVETPNPSAKVLERIGVPSVCEAAAMLAANTDRLILGKRKSGRATLAAALNLT